MELASSLISPLRPAELPGATLDRIVVKGQKFRIKVQYAAEHSIVIGFEWTPPVFDATGDAMSATTVVSRRARFWRISASWLTLMSIAGSDAIPTLSDSAGPVTLAEIRRVVYEKAAASNKNWFRRHRRWHRDGFFCDLDCPERSK